MNAHLTRNQIFTLALATILVGGVAIAGTAWTGTGMSIFGARPTGNPAEIKATSNGSLHTYGGAATSSATAEVLVLNSAATAVPASALSGRKAIEIQNLGPNAIYCRCDGTNPVVSKARKLDASGGLFSIDCDDTACACKCIAATADQVTTAATIVTEIK